MVDLMGKFYYRCFTAARPGSSSMDALFDRAGDLVTTHSKNDDGLCAHTVDLVCFFGLVCLLR
jgi:hypothetical protein